MKRLKLKRGLRKRFIVYTPDYKASIGVKTVGRYKTCYSWRQVKQLLKKKDFGVGSHINECHLYEDGLGGIYFWIVAEQWEWC